MLGAAGLGSRAGSFEPLSHVGVNESVPVLGTPLRPLRTVVLTVRTVGNRAGVAVIAQFLPFRSCVRCASIEMSVGSMCAILLSTVGVVWRPWDSHRRCGICRLVTRCLAGLPVRCLITQSMSTCNRASVVREPRYMCVPGHHMVVMRLNRRQRRCWKLPEGRRTASCKSNSRKELRSCVAQLDYPLRPTNAANGR